MGCYRSTLCRFVLAVGAAALVLGCVDARRARRAPGATTDSATNAINPGLYPFATNHSSVDISSSTQCQKGDCVLKVDITYPTPAAVDETQAFPVVVLINGFQTKMQFYLDIAEALAARGYAVVQYQTTTIEAAALECLVERQCGLPMVTDRVEVTFLAPVLEHAEQLLKGGGLLEGADFSRIGLMGHSRGGKLAALHITSNDSRFVTALLLDPVDGTQWHQDPTDFPSALEALQKLPRTLGVVGAGVGWDALLSCNPAGKNSTFFAAAASPGTWFALLPRAGHMRFIHAGAATEFLFNQLCHSGSTSNEVAQEIAQQLAVAWMELHLRGGQQPFAPGSALCMFLEAAGSGTVQLLLKAADGTWQAPPCQAPLPLLPS